MGKISNYARVLKAKLQDVFVIDSTDSNVTSTKSVTVEQVGDAICGEQVHSDLKTDNQTIIGSINELAKDKNIADEYDDTHTYNTGDVTIYDNTLYICNTNNTTGTFDPSKWTATTIDNIIGSLTTLTTSDKSSLVGAVNEVNGACLKSSGLRVIRETLPTNNNGTIDSNAMTGGAIPLSKYILSAYSPEGYFVMVSYYSSRYTFDIFDKNFNLVRNTNVEICVIAVESLTL